MNYLIVNEDQLTTLQQGLEIIAGVSRDLLPSSLYLYGILRPDSPILEYVEESVWEANYAGEVKSESLDINTAVVAIRLSEDILRILLGRGLKCEDEDFVYSIEKEVRTGTFLHGVRKPTISLGHFSKIALADDSYWLSDFFQREAVAQESAAPGIIRTEPVAQKGGVLPDTVKESSMFNLANVLLTRKFDQ